MTRHIGSDLLRHNDLITTGDRGLGDQASVVNPILSAPDNVRRFVK